MRPITAYKTSDGQVFEDEAEAKRHQDAVDLKAELESFVESFYYSSIRAEDVVDGMMEHWARLKLIVNKYPKY